MTFKGERFNLQGQMNSVFHFIFFLLVKTMLQLIYFDLTYDIFDWFAWSFPKPLIVPLFLVDMKIIIIKISLFREVTEGQALNVLHVLFHLILTMTL